MLKPRHIAVLALAGFLLSGCSRLFGPSDNVENLYQVYDMAGTLLAAGKVRLTVGEDGTVTGTWAVEPMREGVDGSRIGPQLGEGRLDGGIVEGTLRLNLNPDWEDNNVWLVGVPTGEGYEGTWQYVGFAGVLEQGPFRLVH